MFTCIITILLESYGLSTPVLIGANATAWRIVISL